MIYHRIKELCKHDNISVNKLEQKLDFAKGSLCRIDINKPSGDKLQRLANFFGVTVEYLNTGKEVSALTKRNEKEINDILLSTEVLLQQKGLMLDGAPASPEAVESILSAMKIGMEMAKQRNKEKYTLKKYRKKEEL